MKSKLVKCSVLSPIVPACILMALPSQAVYFGPEAAQFHRVSYYYGFCVDSSSAGMALGSLVFSFVQALCTPWLRTACFAALWLAVGVFMAFRHGKPPVALRFDALMEAVPAVVLGGVASVSALACVFEGPSLVTGTAAFLLALALAGQVGLIWREHRACQ